MTETENIWLDKATAVRRAFTPAAPVTDQELFAGRQDQLLRLLDSVEAKGEHAAIFGERGVGKTSLATIAEEISNLRGHLAVRVNCQANDSFADVWRRIGEALDRWYRIALIQGDARAQDLESVVPPAVELLTSRGVSSHEILTALQVLSTGRPFVVFMDEFDRLGASNIKTELVDLMKTLSDHALDVTIVVVGVADDVDSLIEEHESIGRALNEIEMPRMSTGELSEVIDRGLRPAGMVAEDAGKDFIAQLSMGLPHYTHLMALQASLHAIATESNVLRIGHVLESLPLAAERAQQHVTRLYHSATHSTQANMFREVLLAAALTPTDERGFFAPGDVRDPLAIVMKRRYEIPAFASHLSQFADARGPALQKSGKPRRPRYRFVEPLLVPYACMRGVGESIIEFDDMIRLLERRGRTV